MTSLDQAFQIARAEAEGDGWLELGWDYARLLSANKIRYLRVGASRPRNWRDPAWSLLAPGWAVAVCLTCRSYNSQQGRRTVGRRLREVRDDPRKQQLVETAWEIGWTRAVRDLLEGWAGGPPD